MKQPPTIRMRRLAAELRKLRQQADLTRDEVSERTQINTTTLYRLETARVRPQGRTLTTLLQLYGVDEEQTAEMMRLLKESAQRGWLQSYHSQLPEMYNTYINFESEAEALLNYESAFIPGLLQTEDYAHAVIRGVLPHASRDQIAARVVARMERKETFNRDTPLQLWAIVDEAVIRRRVGSPDVMKQQLACLIEMAEHPYVTLQVIPFEDGPHPGMLGAFVVMKFEGPASPDVVYIESGAGDLFLEDEANIARYTLTYEHLRAVALSPDATLSMLAAVSKQY